VDLKKYGFSPEKPGRKNRKLFIKKGFCLQERNP
jgi:hypothetical protein